VGGTQSELQGGGLLVGLLFVVAFRKQQVVHERRYHTSRVSNPEWVQVLGWCGKWEGRGEEEVGRR